MMKPQEHIQRAEQLCQRLRNASTQIGSRDRPRTIRGADPNELKKILTFLMERRDMGALKKLIDRLPTSNFAQRSGSTVAYYKNIQLALGPDFFKLPAEDAVYILGWMCRLL
jgi:hypothetical protein